MARLDQDVDTEFEVAPTMHLDNSRDPIDKRPGVEDKKPIIEKHITDIPQDDDTTNVLHSSSNSQDSSNGEDSQKEPLKEKIKKHLPGHHHHHHHHNHHHNSEVTNEDDSDRDAINLSKQDSGSSDFEVAGFMPMTSSDSGSSGGMKKRPNLERHISSIPEKDSDLDDGEGEGGVSGKLKRTISHVVQKT